MPKNPDNSAIDYLPEPSQDGAFAQTYIFENFLKPYLVVTARDAKTGKLVKGACIGIHDNVEGGNDFAGCDGKLVNGHGDQDGRKNGKIKTIRLPNTGDFTIVNTSPFPNGYRAAKPRSVSAGPAEAGEFVPVTIKLRPRG